MVFYQGRMCQCGLHAVLWSHIGTLMHFLAAEPLRTFILRTFIYPRTFILCKYLCGETMLTLYSMAWDLWV